MNILAFDTCMGACSVAVGVDAGPALEKIEVLFEVMKTGQAERLMPMIDEAMAAAGLSFAKLDRIAVTVGPGTFTGTRISIASARALGLATGAHLVGLPTLELMAREAVHLLPDHDPNRPFAVTVDAYRGQVYCQVFSGSDATALGAPEVLDIGEAASRAGCFVGSGAALVADHARQSGKEAQAALETLQPNAAFLILYAQQAEPVSRTDLKPLYLRPPDAKPQSGKALQRQTS